MKIAVFGGTGRSGRVFIKRALEMGFDVVVAIHSYKLEEYESEPRLAQYSCDINNVDSVRQVLQGCDIVVSLIGHGRHTPAHMQTDAMYVLILGMHEMGIKRIISLTGTGVRVPGDRYGFIDWSMNSAIQLIDPARIEDGIAAAHILINSDLAFTLLRVMKLTNQKTCSYVLTHHGPGKLFVSRREVADAILQMIEADSFVRQAPIISSA